MRNNLKSFFNLLRVIVILIFFTFSHTICYSQNTQIDSLLVRIDELKLSNVLDTNLSRIEYSLAMEYSSIEDPTNAIIHSLEAIKYVGDNSELQFKTHNSLGAFYLDRGDYVQSLKEFNTALQIAIDQNDLIRQGMVHYNLSVHFDETKNDSLSYIHLMRSYFLISETSDTIKTIYLLNALADFDRIRKDHKKADSRYNQALQISYAYDDSNLISSTLNNYANYYLSISDTNQALTYLKESFSIDEKFGSHKSIIIVSMNIAKMYDLLGKPDSSLFYYDIARTHANISGDYKSKGKLHSRVFDVYYGLGRFDTLQQIFLDYRLLNDSLLSRTHLKKYAEAQNEIEMMASNQEMKLLKIKQESDQQELIFTYAAVILMVIFLIVSFLMRIKVKQQKQLADNLNIQLTNQNNTIEDQQVELLKKNNALEKNALDKDRIMSLLAHDLRTPFSTIHNLNHLVSESGSLNKKQTKWIDTSNKVVLSGLDLISDILSIYKLENMDNYEFEEIQISMLLSNSIKKIEPNITVKEQRIISDYDDNIEFVTNREMLQSAVDNLLSNASKYSKKGQPIVLKAYMNNDQLIIQIIDQGLGFNVDEQKKVFDKFNKFVRSSVNTEPSTGLGLFLVKGFVEKLNGKISLKSEWKKGSTFTLTFSPIELN